MLFINSSPLFTIFFLFPPYLFNHIVIIMVKIPKLGIHIHLRVHKWEKVECFFFNLVVWTKFGSQIWNLLNCPLINLRNFLKVYSYSQSPDCNHLLEHTLFCPSFSLSLSSLFFFHIRERENSLKQFILFHRNSGLICTRLTSSK